MILFTGFGGAMSFRCSALKLRVLGCSCAFCCLEPRLQMSDDFMRGLSLNTTWLDVFLWPGPTCVIDIVVIVRLLVCPKPSSPPSQQQYRFHLFLRWQRHLC